MKEKVMDKKMMRVEDEEEEEERRRRRRRNWRVWASESADKPLVLALFRGGSVVVGMTKSDDMI
jgi:hypothetical protein